MADIFNIAGEINSTSQEGTAVHANQVKDDLKNRKQSQINKEVGEELELHTNRLNALTGQNYITVQATQSTTVADIPTLINATGEGEQADTLYRVGFWDGSAYVADKYTEYAWNGTAYVILDVKSSVGEVFDISQYNAVGGTPATYADLTDAISGTNVPTTVRTGGMSVKFIQSSDNKYVQYRLMSDSFNTTVANWQGVDDEPIVGSVNLVKSGGVDKIINGTSVIKGASFEGYKWYTFTAVGEPLTLNTSYSYCFAYKGLIPQGTYAIDVFGKGGTNARLWYTLDADENVVRMSGDGITSDQITIQDEEVYIVVQTNNINTNPGKIIFYNSASINHKIEQLQQIINNKLIKLAKWGGAGNPTDLHIGDIYTIDGSQLTQVDAITDGVVTGFHNIPLIDGAIYTLYDELYIYNGIRLQKDNRVITLTGIGNLASSGINAIGQFYFNKFSNKIFRCTHYNTTPQDSTFEEMIGLANTDTLYLCKGSIYYYDGTNMVSTIGNNIPMGDKLTVDDNGKPRNISVDENYGLQVGYIADGYYSNDPTRVSTKLLNAMVKDVNIKVASDNFEIRGYTSFDANYNRIEYVSILANRKEITLTKGYYYSVTFSKIDTRASVTPDEIASYIWIDDRIKLNELSNKVLLFIDVVIDVASLAEQNTWYQGQTIGDVITKSTVTNCYALKQAVTTGEVYQLTAKGGSGGRGWYLLDEDDKIVALANKNFNDTINITIPNGVAYLLIQSNDGIANLALTKYGKVGILLVKVEELETSVENIETDITNLNNRFYSFKCLTSFLWNKLSRMKNLATGFCNIGFIGDSWTQGTQDSIVQGKYEGYVKHLTKMLQDEYGYGGLGWLDFARDGGVGKMFGCAEMYESWSYTFEGNITGVDAAGSPSTPPAQCFGICVAHTIFGNASSLTLNFNAGILDKFVLRYYKNAHFNVSVNGGAAVEVTANSTDGWQETEFGVTGTDTTSVVITSLADDSIIFGMDCFYGNHGVRIHKIGNRSISAAGYIGMDATQWETGISKLNLCWASVLLAINDLGSSTSESTMDAIVTRIGTLIDRLKIATDDGNGLVTCDINLLGVENIEAATWTGLGRLAEKQKAFAFNNGYGWCSTDKCIGSKKDEFTYNGTFSDTIHLNKIGSYAYAAHIYNSLFKF